MQAKSYVPFNLPGGNYFVATKTILTIAGRPLLWEDPTPNGEFAFGFDLLDERNRPVVEIRKNSLDVNAAAVWDCLFSPQGRSFIVRRDSGRVALKIAVHRITLEEIQEKYAAENGGVYQPGTLGQISPNTPSQQFWKPIEDKCVDSDGRICFIDFERAHLNANGRRFVIRNNFELGHDVSVRGNVMNGAVGGFSFPGFPVFAEVFKKRKDRMTLDDAEIICREFFIGAAGRHDPKIGRMIRGRS